MSLLTAAEATATASSSTADLWVMMGTRATLHSKVAWSQQRSKNQSINSNCDHPRFRNSHGVCLEKIKPNIPCIGFVKGLMSLSSFNSNLWWVYLFILVFLILERVSKDFLKDIKFKCHSVVIVILNDLPLQNQFSKDEIRGTDADHGGPLHSGW